MILFQTNKLSDKKIFPIIKKTPDFYKEIKWFIAMNSEKMTINVSRFSTVCINDKGNE